MGNLSGVKKPDALPEFQAFLLERKLAPEKNAPFYALWVSKFLNFARANCMPSDQYQEKALIEFIENLKADSNLSDWQVRQAHDAIKLFYFHYLGFKPNLLTSKNMDKYEQALLAETKRLIRLKHYSYSTEHTYLHWIGRFLSYAVKTGKKVSPDALVSEDCKHFLTHLALKDRVSASTQNQAFNALLFLFRNVLGKDMENLKETVRAKRGQKLPVVFSVEETKRLLNCLAGKDWLIASLLYGTGMRLMELARLRVKDIDMDTITVRSGKGDKDRATILPAMVKELLRKHLVEVKKLHDKDLALGHGDVHLPNALSTKYPNAGNDGHGNTFSLPAIFPLIHEADG